MFLLTLAVGLGRPFPEHDCCGWFFPMAQAVGEGDWATVFNSLASPFFPVVSGGLAWIFHLTPEAGVFVASALGFALALYPVWLTSRRLWGPRQAGWSVLLFTLCHRLFELGSAGIRDIWAVFSLAWIAYALVRQRQQQGWDRRSAGAFVLGAATYILNRDEGLPLFLAATAGFLLVDGWNRGWFRRRRRLLGLAAGILTLLAAGLGIGYACIGDRILPREIRQPLQKISCDPAALFLDPRQPQPEELQIRTWGFWTAKSSHPWIHIVPDHGWGPATVKLELDPNGPRNTTALVKFNAGGDTSAFLKVSWSAETALAWPESRLKASYHGAEVRVIPRVPETVPVACSTQADWIQIRSQGRQPLAIAIAPNPWIWKRSGELSVEGGGKRQILSVEQEATPLLDWPRQYRLTRPENRLAIYEEQLRCGLYELYFPLYVLAIAGRLRRRANGRRAWTAGESPMLLLVLVTLPLLVIGGMVAGHLESRHIMPVLGILLGWAGLTARQATFQWGLRRAPGSWRPWLALAIVLGLVAWVGYKDLRSLKEHWTKADRIANVEAAAQWLRQHRQECLRPDSAPTPIQHCRPASVPNNPVAMEGDPYVAWKARLRSVARPETPSLNWDTLAAICRQPSCRIDLVIADARVRRHLPCPETEDGEWPGDTVPPGFILLYKASQGEARDHVWILKCVYEPAGNGKKP